MEPWKVIKTDEKRTETILNISLQITANLAIAFEPFLPFSAKKIADFINAENLSWDKLGRTDLLPTGHSLGESGLLFAKIEDEAIEKQLQKLQDTKKANEAELVQTTPQKADIAFEEFEKIDIRVGTVLECIKVPKADKLLQFLIDDGMEKRTIISGIAQWYKPEDLVGKQVCFIANLAPRKLRGVMSQGMILSAQNADGSLSVIQPSSPVNPGSQVV